MGGKSRGHQKYHPKKLYFYIIHQPKRLFI